MKACPTCGERGGSVKPITIEAQATSPRREAIDGYEGWRLCMSSSCNVVYFREQETIESDETRAIPFHKSADPKRLVCFCFEHSVEDIEADVRQLGRSTIQESITAACKTGSDDCERKNPQGRCCLGNVGQVLKRVGVELSDRACCPSANDKG